MNKLYPEGSAKSSKANQQAVQFIAYHIVMSSNFIHSHMSQVLSISATSSELYSSLNILFQVQVQVFIYFTLKHRKEGFRAPELTFMDVIFSE